MVRVMNRLRPLNLPGRKSHAPPDIPLPPTPAPPASPLRSEAASDAISAFEIRSAALQPNPYDAVAEPNMPSVLAYRRGDGAMVPTAPNPPPPFRLLAPSVVAHEREPSPDNPRLSLWSEAPMAPPPMRSPALSVTPRPQMRGTPSFDPTRDRRLTLELRARPLHQSEYGRTIVDLLTMPWFIAPSGLAAAVFAEDVPDDHVANVASHINLLVCGAEAFRSVAAGVIAVSGLDKLNKLLMRSGLSPIVPQEAPLNWGPMIARQPPDFLTQAYRPRPSLLDAETSL